MATQSQLFHEAATKQPDSYEVHEHMFVSGPRRDPVKHSHLGGSIPHEHPHTGPSFYGYRKPKTTKKPTGEQLHYVARTEEQNSFELVITDSALVSVPFKKGGKGQLVPIGNTPVEALGFPAADRMMRGSRLKCIVRDEREGKQA